MYILNPTLEQLNSWYKCSIKVGKYIINHFHISPVFIDKNYYYFLKTNEFIKIEKKIPFWIKI